MKTPSIHITGGAGALGRSFAVSMREKMPQCSIELSDINAVALEKVAADIAATRYFAGDVFDCSSGVHNGVNTSNANVKILNAAINLDALPDSQRLPLRGVQTASLLDHVRYMADRNHAGEVERTLLVVVNSISAIFGQQLEFIREVAKDKNWQYGIMKGEQSDLLREWRGQLHSAGVDLAVLYPGSFASTFTDEQEALKNANAVGKKVRDYRGRKNLTQERLFEPREITDAVAELVVVWNQTGQVPVDQQEWILLNASDLRVK